MKKLDKIALAIAGLVPSLAFAAPATPPVEPLEGSVNAQALLGNIIGWLLTIIAALAIIFIIIGGIQYIISAGNAEKAGAAKKTIMYALIGLAVVLLAWVLISTLTTLLGTAVNG